MKTKKILGIIFCIVLIALTILRSLIDTSTFWGSIVWGIWIASGFFVTAMGIVRLIKARKRK